MGRRVTLDAAGRRTEEYLEVHDLAALHPGFGAIAGAISRSDLVRMTDLRKRNGAAFDDLAKRIHAGSCQIDAADEARIAANILGGDSASREATQFSIPDDLFLHEAAIVSLFDVPGCHWKVVVVTPARHATRAVAEIAMRITVWMGVLVLILCPGALPRWVSASPARQAARRDSRRLTRCQAKQFSAFDAEDESRQRGLDAEKPGVWETQQGRDNSDRQRKWFDLTQTSCEYVRVIMVTNNPLTFDLKDELLAKLERLQKSRGAASKSEVIRDAIGNFDYGAYKPANQGHRQLSVRIPAKQKAGLIRQARKSGVSIGELLRVAIEALPAKAAAASKSKRR